MKEDGAIGKSHYHFLQVFWKTLLSYKLVQAQMAYTPDSASDTYSSKALVLEPLKKAWWVSKEFCEQLVWQSFTWWYQAKA